MTLVQALQRLMALVVEKIRSTGELAADVISKMIDAMMGAAVELLETMRDLHNKNYGILTREIKSESELLYRESF